MSRIQRSAAVAALALVAGMLACADATPEARDLPREWYTADEDPRTGGRWLPEARLALDRFQQGARSDGRPLLYPHYADSDTVVLAVKRDFVETGARRRLAVLLEHERDDPALRIVALTDRPASVIRTALDLGPLADRLVLREARLPGDSHASFQFLRDYAPLALAHLGPEGYRIAGLTRFRAATLNKVVDARLGVRTRRSGAAVQEKAALAARLASLYAEWLGPVPVAETELRLDGGNLITDGLGTCFSTAVLGAKNEGRAAFVGAQLREHAGCRRHVTLLAPQRLDFVQHVDTLLAFAGPHDAVLSMPTLYESDKTAEFRNVRTLLELGYRVHRVPRRTASITYTNLLITPRHVYLPQYTRYQVESAAQTARDARIEALIREGRMALASELRAKPVQLEVVENDPVLAQDNARARRVLEALFPSKRVVPVDSDETLQTRGSWHCLSLFTYGALDAARLLQER